MFPPPPPPPPSPEPYPYYLPLTPPRRIRRPRVDSDSENELPLLRRPRIQPLEYTDSEDDEPIHPRGVRRPRVVSESEDDEPERQRPRVLQYSDDSDEW